MSAVDNLETSIKNGKVLFDSLHPIDKILITDTITDVNDGSTSFNQEAKIKTITLPNPYGKKVFIRAKWTIDGVNYNSLDTHIVYTYTYNTVAPAPVTSATLSGLKAAVSVGVSDSSIVFLTGNGLHGNVTDNGTVITYTPTPQTFTITYVLYEKE